MAETAATILLVDDEPADLRVIAELLEQAGHLVLKASNAYQALQQCTAVSTQIDLVITDVALPGKNGIDLFDELCGLCQSNLKVLFISAYSGSELLRLHGVSMNDLHFLPKPFSGEELSRRVRMLLDSSDTFAFPLQGQTPT